MIALIASPWNLRCQSRKANGESAANHDDAQMILLSYTSANETKCVSPDVDFCAQFTEQESPCYVEKNRSDGYRGRVSPEAALSDDASFDTAFGARLMKLRLTINGENKEVSIDTRTSLLDLIRETLGLTGTKVDSLHAMPSAKILAGGTNLVDLMKQSIEKPSLIIDINHLDLAEITELSDGGPRLGALARNADTANHPLVRQRYPMLARAILSGASPQLRNLATKWWQSSAAHPVLLLLRSSIPTMQ
jgi:hypothetical protein